MKAMSAINKERRSGALEDPTRTDAPIELLQNALELLVKNRSVEWIAQELGYSEQQLLAALRYSNGSARNAPSTHRPRTRSLRTSRRKLDRAMEARLRALIMGNTPDRLELNSWLWDKTTVGMLVERHSGIRLPARTLSTYLDRWGFNPTKPVQQVHRSKPKLIREWMKRSYPYIAEQAREEGAELFWLGTADLSAQLQEHPNGTSGMVTTALSTLEVDDHFELLFIVSNRRQMLWSVQAGAIGERDLKEFIERAVNARSSKIHVLIEISSVFNPDTLNEMVRAIEQQATITFFEGRFGS